ncbi:MAG: NAD(P)H-hydrate epimerase [Acidimicrobiia bacterium]
MSHPTLPVRESTGIPSVTMEQMQEVDRVMIEDLHIDLAQMMENAGRNLARVALDRFRPQRTVVLVGSGGNGGGGMVAARHLANWGNDLLVVLGRAREALDPVPAHQLDVLERMGVPISTEPESGDLHIDALIGYSLVGDPRGRPGELITWLNSQPAPVLSLDTPSGLDVTTGTAGEPSVRADATLTLAAPKTGLIDSPKVGELYLADISVPPTVYAAFGLEMPSDLFADSTVVRLVSPSQRT